MTSTLISNLKVFLCDNDIYLSVQIVYNHQNEQLSYELNNSPSPF